MSMMKFEVWKPFGCEGINLDGLDEQDLWKFSYDTHGVKPLTLARTLFPSKPKGYLAATKQLGHYAANKATAMACRKRGDIATAERYERIAQSIYITLPEFAKW